VVVVVVVMLETLEVLEVLVLVDIEHQLKQYHLEQ